MIKAQNKKLNIFLRKSISLSGILVGGYLVFLFLANKITFYIHPNYIFFALLMGIILIGVNIYGLFFYNVSSVKTAVRILFPTLIICVLGFLLTPTPLTSNTALRRGLETNSLGITNSGDTINLFSAFGQDTRNFDIATWLKTFSVNPEPSEYVGKKLSVTGFYHIEPNTPSGYFIVGRYLITCCSIDARPIGINVVIDGNIKFSEGDWIKVDGEFGVKKIDGKDTIVILPSEVKSEVKPSNPYLY